MLSSPDEVPADALDLQRWTSAHTTIAGALLLVFFINTYCTEIFALTVPAIAEAWKITPRQLAVAMAMGWLGSGIGSFVGGVLGDRIGRYRTVLICSAATAAATLASTLVTEPIGLTLVRTVVGLALGATVPPALALITECAPRKARGLMVSLAMICAPLGLSVCAAISAILLPTHGWRVVFLIGGGATLAITLLFALIAVESPRFLARKAEWRPRLDRVLHRLRIAPETVEVVRATEQQPRSPAMAVLSARYLGLTLRTWLCFAAVFIATTALTSWVPTALTQAGYSTPVASSAISAWSLGGIPGTLFAGWCLTRFGVRRATMVIAVGSALSLLLAAVVRLHPDAGNLPVIVPMAASGFMMSAMITCIFAFATDAYPVDIRSTGVGMSAMIGRSSAVIGSYGGIYALDAMGIHGFFALIGALYALPLLMLWTLPRHTAASPPAGA
jgi:AAHS family 4-hydroxybenzoate transporter-like MFS transporter